MVFSFFKKQTEKMPERPVAKPKPAAEVLPEVLASQPAVREEVAPPAAEQLPDLEFTASSIAAALAATPAPAPTPTPVPTPTPAPTLAAEQRPPAEGPADDFSSWSNIDGINVDHDVDPLESGVEQVAVMFANGQDGAVRSTLETFLQAYPGREGKRFWLMLFDLLQVAGDRAAFDKLGVDYVLACETSPPAWHGYATSGAEAPVSRGNGVRKVYLQGVLTEDNPKPVAELRDLVGRKLPVVIDCGKLIGCDDEMAGQLADLLQRARKARLAVNLADHAGFLKRLDDRAVVGDPAHEPVWQLLLEILQRHATQERFEERAVDYAVTFERSPPSWEALPAGVAAPAETPRAHGDDAHYLRGELKNCRFDELAAVLDGSAQPILDFSEVLRLDFVSAGQLVNRLTPYKAQGKEITIRSPNRLVAELMAVVGLNKLARVIVLKS